MSISVDVVRFCMPSFAFRAVAKYSVCVWGGGGSRVVLPDFFKEMLDLPEIVRLVLYHIEQSNHLKSVRAKM